MRNQGTTTFAATYYKLKVGSVESFPYLPWIADEENGDHNKFSLKQQIQKASNINTQALLNE